jgi:polyisoprenoid-binding protein YceI
MNDKAPHDASGATDATPPHLLEGLGVGPWVLDASGSSVAFRHKTMWGLVTVKGTFAHVDAVGEIGSDGTVQGRMELVVASLDTKNPKRDKHLRSRDFFDADDHPLIVFTVNRVVPKSDSEVVVGGDLEVAGVSRPLEFPARVTEASGQAVTLEADVTIDRAGFGSTWNQLGMLKGPATVSIVARLTPAPPRAERDPKPD